jgi:microcystin-dependent protein
MIKTKKMENSNNMIGSIIMYAGELNNIPDNWLICNGQSCLISQYPELFQVIGTQFGGNGTQDFNLPVLQDRTIVGSGSGPGLTPRTVGDEGGENLVMLTIDQLPSHKHKINCSTTMGSATTPSNSYPAVSSDKNGWYGNTANGRMNENAISYYGTNRSHGNRQPYLVLYAFICAK